jgi:hypothetical protein
VVRHYVHDLRFRHGVACGQSGRARRLGNSSDFPASSCESAGNNACRAQTRSAEFSTADHSTGVEQHASVNPAGRAAASSGAAKEALGSILVREFFVAQGLSPALLVFLGEASNLRA